MMRTALAFFILAAGWGTSFVVAQTAQAASAAGRYTISGVVVSAQTGQPLDRVEVSLQTTSSQRSQVAGTITGAGGQFSFEQLAAGKYSLRASRRGYMTSAYDEHEGFSTAIVTGEGLISTGLRFRLPAQALIGGTVTDDFGDPVSQAQVSLYRQNTRNGLGNIVRAGSTTVDDLGEYEFRRLQPGNYFLAVNATPWYAARRQDTGGGITFFASNLATSADSPRSPLDVAYPLTFYLNATESDEATPISLKAGDRAQINVAMHAVPGVHLSVQVHPGPHGEFRMPQLRQEVFGSPSFVSANSSFTPRVGGGADDSNTMTVEMSGVAPGHYEMDMNRQGGAQSYLGNLDATGDHVIDGSAGSEMADISGKVAMVDGEKLPQSLNITLLSPEGSYAGQTRVDADGSFTFHGIQPGIYEIWVGSAGASLAVAEMTASGAATEGHTLKVGSQPVTIAALLAEGTSDVTGFVTRNSKPAPGMMVLLVPKSQGAYREMFRRDQSDSDGSFSLSKVIPGDYTLVAIEDGWTLDWAHPQAIARYLASGVKVRVLPHGKDISLKDSIEVQAK